jgi:hypothetical protein
MKLICDNRSWLFANEASVKTINFRDRISSCTNRNPLVGLLICHWSLLFSYFAFSSFGLITWAAKDRSNVASSCDIVAIYTPLVR